MPPETVLLLVGAGVAAGLCGSMAGLASLFSYPALLAVGLPATTANVTNTVALAFSTVGAAAGSRPELAGQARTVGRLALVALPGGALGAGLLLLTPPGVFEVVVPVLVAGASVALLLQPRLRARGERRRRADGPGAVSADALGAPVGSAWPSRPVLAGVLLVSVYGGYFGAAAGVLMLALVLVGLPVSLLQGNALKTVLLGLANLVAAAGFAFFGPVEWWAVPPMAAGLLVGAWCGPALARRLPAAVLRTGIALAGMGLAVSLAVQSWV
ncbi:sulfite exporter TauE/SafE family protein [Pseudonocardia lacus]|uniref:sulfite exporter TauE/SafE family protein n=1 Tax=Pseudonocardia lacus TaxID=2835865 RepID=UPI0027E356A8|nr:sulfite exporter TauE/SafE family protein [Pseudonocardia lacus]